MKIGTKDFGNAGFEIIKQSVASPGAGGSVEIAFDQLQSERNGLVNSVLAIAIVMPTLALTIPATKLLDGVSIAQSIANLSLTLADGAPPSAYEGRRLNVINNCDGYRLAAVCETVTGMPIFSAFGVPQISALPTVAGTAATSMSSVNNLVGRTGVSRDGRLYEQGPFGSATSVAPSAFSDRPTFYLPIGCRAGEELGEYAIPASWLNGKSNATGNDCCGTPGKITITLASTIDGIACTQTGVLDVYAIVMRFPKAKQPVPPCAYIRTWQTSESRFNLDMGLTGVQALMKPLSAGAMQSHGYSNVAVYVDGMQLENNNLTYQSLVTAFVNGDRQPLPTPWVPIGADTALPSVTATGRRACYGVQLLQPMHSVLKETGSTASMPVMDLVTYSETAPFLGISYTFTPVTPQVAAAAAAWVGGDAVVSPSPANGNRVSPEIAQAVPNKALPLTNALAAK